MKSFTTPMLCLIVALAVFTTSCFNKYDELVPVLPSVPAGGVDQISLQSVSDEVVELEVTIFAVDHFGSFIEGLSQKDFSIDLPSGYAATIESVERVSAERLGPYSATMLFDQSGSISGTDPSNDRVTAGVQFVDLLGNGDEASVVAFTSGGQYQSPFEVLSGFSRDRATLQQIINSLADNEGGGTPLYRSMFEMIGYTSDNATNTNKAIIAFTDGKDTNGGVSIDAIVEEACANDIKIFTVGLSSGIDAGELSEVAFRTGGAVMLAADAQQLVSLYSSLGELLHGEAEFYKLRMSVRNPSGSFRAGSRVSGFINLNLSEQYPVQLPFQFELTRENAGSFDQREPACDCGQLNAGDLVQKWKDEAETLRNSISNPSPANEGITCAYVDIYNRNPEKFKWAGLAALVSGEVGEQVDNPLLALDPGFSSAFIANAITGNAAVFEDLAWQHLAFQNGGIEEIAKIYCSEQSNPNPAISLDVYRAWLKIASGDADLVWEGNRDLLYHEQLNVLQALLYDPHPIMWSWIEGFGLLESPVPGHTNEFDTGRREIDRFIDRWNWIESDILPAWRAFESNSLNETVLTAEFNKYCQP
ncbi:MAG: vWA domain-containing protein [Bacteroidota bacterium]